jgi:hypothetical protein
MALSGHILRLPLFKTEKGFSIARALFPKYGLGYNYIEGLLLRYSELLLGRQYFN